MANLLDSISGIAYSALKNIFRDATLLRDARAAGGTAYEPTTTITTTSYACKAIQDTFGKGELAAGLVEATDARVLVLAASLSATPQPLDRITIQGQTFTVVPESSAGAAPVQSDPARATWILRCRK